MQAAIPATLQASPLSDSRRALWSVSLIAICCWAVSSCVAVLYADQKPLDMFSFRQTQTALTAYWLKQNGFSLAYETPVAGAPWSIPFEFPIYQWLVATASGLLTTSLDATARVVSYLFLVACVFPALAITKRLKLSPLVFPLFCIFLFSSPTYLYWGRTFMIETAALFFSVAAVRHFVDLLLDPGNRRSGLLFILFMSLGLLQKITTAFPVFFVLAIVLVVSRTMARRRAVGGWIHADVLLEALLLFGIPLVIGVAWTVYTDEIKQLNTFGNQLTSSALRSWNIGTWQQRLTKPLYSHVIEERIFQKNLGGFFGLLLIAVSLTLKWFSRPAWVLWIALAIGFLPVLVFSNLHLVHDYYECGNLLFIIFALSVALGDLLARHVRSLLVLLLAVAFVVASDYRAFALDYLPYVRTTYTDANDTELAIANVIHAQVPADKIFVAFDFDWSSSLAYLSERKAFMVASIFKQVESARVDPTRFVDSDRLGAVVACPKDERRMRELLDWSVRDRRWKIGQVDECYVAVPESGQVVGQVLPATDRCAATAIDVLPVRGSASLRVVRLRLRRAGSDPVGATFATGASSTDLHEMFDVTRRSARPGIDSSLVPDLEFTRLVDLGPDGDDASVRVYRTTADGSDACRVASGPRND